MAAEQQTCVVDCLVVVGTGFMGASIAKAAKQRGVAGQVIGVDPKEAANALAAGCLDKALAGVDALKGVCPTGPHSIAVVVASPVKTFEQVFAQLSNTFSGERAESLAWITDIGSTKAGVLRATKVSLLAHLHRFVSSHPMAGSEKQGALHARDDLLVGARVLVSPLTESAASTVRDVESFWLALGAQPSPLPIQDHDDLLASISHLPHVLAFALAGALSQSPLAVAAQALHGGGLRDTTRIAGSSPELWADIFLDNREALLASWSEWSLQLQAMHQALERSDRDLLIELLSAASHWRRGFQ